MSWTIINTRKKINVLLRDLKERKIFLDRFGIEYVEDFELIIIYNKLDKLVGILLEGVDEKGSPSWTTK